jgi:hypothetical protein
LRDLDMRDKTDEVIYQRDRERWPIN